MIIMNNPDESTKFSNYHISEGFRTTHLKFWHNIELMDKFVYAKFGGRWSHVEWKMAATVLY